MHVIITIYLSYVSPLDFARYLGTLFLAEKMRKCSVYSVRYRARRRFAVGASPAKVKYSLHTQLQRYYAATKMNGALLLVCLDPPSSAGKV